MSSKRVASLALFLVVVFPFDTAISQVQPGSASGVPVPGSEDPNTEIEGLAEISFVPEDAAHPMCPAFGSCPPALQITTEYVGFGVDFTAQPGQPPVGIFDDFPEEWGGVNAAEVLDLLTDVHGRIVVPGSTDQGATDFLAVTAGFVNAPEDILLEAFDADDVLVGSSFGDDGFGPDSRHLAIVDLTGTPVIARFRVTTPTADSFGMRRVYLNNPIAGVDTIEIPALNTTGIVILLLLLSGTGVMLLRQYRQD